MEPRKLDWSNFRTDDNWWREEGRKVARPEDHPWIDELNPLSASGLDTAAREYSHGFWESSSKALGRDIREEFELWVSIYKVAKNSTDDAGHDLPVFWLIHRSLRTYDGKIPALVKIHGGGHTIGHALQFDHLGAFVLDLAIEHHAVLLLPNYRLMPDTRGQEICDDIRQLTQWCESLDTHTCLPLRVPIEKCALAFIGDSSGGAMALEAMLSGSIEPSAVLCQYPVVAPLNRAKRHFPNLPDSNLGEDEWEHWGQTYRKDQIEACGRIVMDKWHAHNDTEPLPVNSGIFPPWNRDLNLILSVGNHWTTMWGSKDLPLQFVNNPRAELLRKPALFVYHGTLDQHTPEQWTAAFISKIKKLYGEESARNIVYESVPKQVHGFDHALRLEETQMRSLGLKDLFDGFVNAWLRPINEIE